MHVFFSAIGGVGIGPLSLIAKDAGLTVSGSDSNESSPLVTEAKQAGINYIDESLDALEKLHKDQPIDWIVYSAGLPTDHPHLSFAKENAIRLTKRDEFLNEILETKSLRMIAIAGTHGKTTTTAMVVWLFKQLGVPVSYSIGSQVSFGPTGHYAAGSQYFIYECDEFDRNFLHFHPYASIITNVDYDHPDTYQQPSDYQAAFRTFAAQSEWVVAWLEDAEILGATKDDTKFTQYGKTLDVIADIPLTGTHNRENAYQAIQLVGELLEKPIGDLLPFITTFPGTNRRFEKLAENIYSDYAHHPAEIRATLQLAREIGDKVIAVYQPHQNRRQHALRDTYGDCFRDAEHVYWVPTYHSREDPAQTTLSPSELVQAIGQDNIETAQLDNDLVEELRKRSQSGEVIVLMGAGDIDQWAREKFI